MFTMSKNRVAAFLLIFNCAFSGASMAGNNSGSKAAASKFVGTYYSESVVMLSLHADGTVEHISSEMFETANTTRLTPALGVWRQMSDNAIRITFVRFQTQPDSHDFGLTARYSYTAVFDESVQGKSPGYSADTIRVEWWLPGGNPVTDDPLVDIEVPCINCRGHRLETN